MAATPENLTEKLDTLYSTTWQLMRSEIVDNIFLATPFWFWLSSKQRIRRESGGRWIGIQTMYAKNSTVGSIGQGGTIDISPQQIGTTAQFNWKWVAGSIIRLYAEDHINKGQQQIMSMIQAKTKNLELSLIDILETQSLGDGSGNGGLDILGIQSIVKSDPTTNPASTVGNIGGIDAATNSWWRNKQRTYSVTGMPTGDVGIVFNMRTLYNTCSVGNDHPTLALTDQTHYEVYEGSLTNILRIIDKDFGDVGFEALRYKGTALTYSPSAVAGELRFLNERYLEFVIEESADFNMTDWKPIPNQLDRVAQVVVQGNLTTSNRRMHGVLTAMP